MDLRLQPKPEVEHFPANRGIVSRKQFFVKKKFEEINRYFSPGHLIRKYKPKAELIYTPSPNNEAEIPFEYDFNREVQNCFIEDNAEEIFLRTPPPCFVIFGKFKREMNNFAKTLANEYGSMLIQIEDIINLVLNMQNETSKILNRILRLGFSITLNFVLALASFLAHTTVARHRGYVLTGLPCIPLSFDLSPEQQFNYILSWENKPTFFISASFEDEDLVNLRLKSRLRVIKDADAQYFRFSKVPDLPTEESDSEDEMSPTELENFSGYEPNINISPSMPSVQLPRYEESRAWQELELYNSILKPVVQSVISRIDPQYFITIDSRIHNQYEIVSNRLNLLQIWKSPSATPFFTPEGEDDTELSQIIEEPPQTAFLKLFTKKTISPKFRWELSHYNYICPVSLREGKILEGKTEFAVSFMKYIYFLQDETCMTKFIANPRAFALPIRPKPLCRFIILGYPFTGKTTLAHDLSKEYSIPVINFKNVLENDLKRKKEVYKEFCRQKAECREITRQTNLAWENWRKEEERRICLIEKWILYIQSLLTQRIQEFYSVDIDKKDDSQKSDSLSRENIPEEGEQMEVSGEHLSQANLILSSVWSSFSNREKPFHQMREEYGEYGEYGEYSEEDDESVEITVNWCNLLPPQSLSSFLMSKEPHTVREKRQSFQIFLDAASKVYWQPSALKSEFAKWRLPCFMNIPLCEKFLDNPLMLMRYVPTWLKERPQIPDPIDSTHPEVIRASMEAYNRASVVTIKQDNEEVGILLRHAIEKAEREGMRVTGEVISPGGWVLDNMTLDLKIWEKLACEEVFADHIYILLDVEPNYQRIINLWWELCGSLLNSTDEQEDENIEEEKDEDRENSQVNMKVEAIENFSSLAQLLIQTVDKIENGEDLLDKIYDSIESNTENDSVEYFTTFRKNDAINSNEVFHPDYDIVSIKSAHDVLSSSTLNARYQTTWDLALGTRLEIVTSKLLNYFKTKPLEDDTEDINKGCEYDDVNFFINLLTLPKKLEELKKWLSTVGRADTVEEIEMTGKTPEEVFQKIKSDLMAPFIKKPRELEEFEIHEIQESTKAIDEEYKNPSEDFTETVVESLEDEIEDVRIFGESGQLCVVNLERNIYLLGKLDFSLRYYGKLYYFWNQDAKNKFIEDPEKYAPYYSAIRCYPPLRIFVTGPSGSGKSSIATSISRQCGVAAIDYPKFLVDSVLPHTDLPSLTGENDFKLLMSEDHNPAAKSSLELFLNSSYSNRQFWLENSTAIENFSKDFILSKIEGIKTPVIVQDYPELSYSCIDSLLPDESNSLSKISLPEISHTSAKELETIILNYINSSTELNEYCVDRSLKTLWTQEPYITKGFVLNNFPMRLFDVKHVIENNWIPDMIIELMVPEDIVIERNIDNLMEDWETKLNREIAEEKILEGTVENIHKISVFFRKEELIEERQLQKFEKIHDLTGQSTETINNMLTESRDFGMEMELKNSENLKTINNELQKEIDQIQAEVENILNEEMPPLSFNPIFESYDEGKLRLVRNLTNKYARDVEEISKLKSEFSGIDVPWVEIDGTKNLNEILPNLHLKLDTIRKRLIHKGEFAFTLSHKLANELLLQGYYFLSKFRRWCPVQVYRMKNPINMYLPFLKREKIIPIAYRNYIYFVAGENEKIKFLQDPIKYTFNEPQHPDIPLRVAVIGPPKCGKTTLSTRLGLMFGLKVITMGSALRFALENAPNSALSQALNDYLKRGCFPPLSLKMEALMLALNDPSCATQGYVFDGVPFDAALTQSLAEKGKLPFVIISLVADSYFGKTNREGLHLEEFRLPYKNRVNLDKRYKDWNDTYKRFSQWNQTTYNNLYEVNAKLSVVEIFYQAYDIIRKSFFGILYYVHYCTSDRVLPLQYLCVSPHEYNLRKTPLKNNCPVCWVEKEMLNNYSNPPPPSGLVQYKSNFFWICPEHMEEFKKNPKKYFYPETPKWPEMVANRITLHHSHDLNIHGHGRCPVTRIDFPKSLDWEGSLEFAAEYAGEIFLCKNAKMLSRFVSKPWKYCNADTKFEVNRHNKSKAIENLGPPLLTSLPPVGFLEQTVVDLIHDCLQLLGTVRPVYPNVSPAVTGCIFIALYLKAHNKRHKTTRLEMEYFSFMLKSCPAFTFMVKERGLQNQNFSDDDKSFSYLDDLDYQNISSSENISRPASTTSSNWMDISIQIEKNLWTSRKIDEKTMEMELTEDETLVEIPTHPKYFVCLQLDRNEIRPNPLPPFSNCLTVLYSPKKSMQLPQKFNYNSLYQPLLSPEDIKKIIFNPERNFSIHLYEDKKPKKFLSKVNIHKGQRTYSDYSVDKGVKLTPSNIEDSYMMERSLPRFKLLDRVKNVNAPSMPRVVSDEYIKFNPLKNYGYSILMSEFFGRSHILRNYDCGMSHYYQEYWDKLNDNLGLTTTQVDFEYQPKRTASMITRTSLDDYREIFDAATSFAVGYRYSDYSDSSTELKESPKSSTYNFMLSLLEEKLEELFTEISLTKIPYDTFEVSVDSLKEKERIVCTEILPFPPLAWDIESRPYHAYSSLFSIMDKIPLHNITHRRRLSILDGVSEGEKKIEFLEIPTGQEEMMPCNTISHVRGLKYFYYDFFNLPWASFLIYPLPFLHGKSMDICNFEK